MCVRGGGGGGGNKYVTATQDTRVSNKQNAEREG